jgi:hypothetical protein
MFDPDDGGDAGALADEKFAGIGPLRNELTAADMADLRAWFARDNRTGLTTLLGFALVAAFLFLVVATIASGDAFSVAGVVAIVALTFLVDRASRQAHRRSDAEVAVSESSIVAADENSVTFRSSIATLTLQWAHFTELVETDRLLILRCGAFAGHPIAKRNLASRQAVGAYADALEQHMSVRDDASRPKQTGRRRSRQFRRLAIVVWIIGVLMLAGIGALFLGEALR